MLQHIKLKVWKETKQEKTENRSWTELLITSDKEANVEEKAIKSVNS